MKRKLLFPIAAFFVLVAASLLSTNSARAQGNCNHMVCTPTGCAAAQSPPNALCWSYMGTCGWDWCQEPEGP
jgi:hypothetical protein